MAYLNFMDGLPRIVKIIFAIPFLAITWIVYRILKAILVKKDGKVNVVQIVIGVVFLALGFISWLADMIFLIIKDQIAFAEL